MPYHAENDIKHYDLCRCQEKVIAAQKRYQNNKQAKVGEIIECALCAKRIFKKSYQTQFCCNRGNGNCKDRFWNMVEKRNINNV